MTLVVIALVLGLALGAGAAALGNDTPVTVALAIEPLGTLWANAIRNDSDPSSRGAGKRRELYPPIRAELASLMQGASGVRSYS